MPIAPSRLVCVQWQGPVISGRREELGLGKHTLLGGQGSLTMGEGSYPAFPYQFTILPVVSSLHKAVSQLGAGGFC